MKTKKTFESNFYISLNLRKDIYKIKSGFLSKRSFL